MDTNWIQYILVLVTVFHSIHGYSDIEARLVVARKYIDKGSSVMFHCEHNVDPKILYKVTFLKENNGKFFQYIKNRNPPYRNFSIPGAEIDLKNSNEDKVHLEKIDFDAAGRYYCEVSTETPIYTKESNIEQVHVIVQQTGPPKITFSKRQFTIGENLVSNCTTSKAHPAPHITWLINGKQVDDKYIRTIHLHSSGGSGSGSSSGGGTAGGGKNSHRAKTLTNSQSRDRHDSNGSSRARTLASQFSQSSGRQEPLAANGNHLGFEIHQNSGYNNNNRNNNHRNNGFSAADVESGYNGYSYSNSNSNVDTSDYFDDKYFETRKYRNPHRSPHRKLRRHTNDLTGSLKPANNSRHRLVATSSQLSIEVSELHALNGRLEISCLATIPARIKSNGEQYADYKTYSVKVDIDTVETTTQLPAISDMAALGNASNRADIDRLRVAATTLNFPILLIVLLNFLRSFSMP
ncbi:uncharacterized protein LOC129567297 [Sitodiplosis mosellana]|uniref:uncharacterized protein LOC129567297 n=1 Tax=Sitodiplosis mosellana TaxID=263140 RepID=UPI0024440B61|nr:uncharacterized protein LOC129567297 [Sitodiplosis mosellana]